MKFRAKLVELGLERIIAPLVVTIILALMAGLARWGTAQVGAAAAAHVAPQITTIREAQERTTAIVAADHVEVAVLKQGFSDMREDLKYLVRQERRRSH